MANSPTNPPRELKPARVNAKAIFLIGTTAWVLALVAYAIAYLAGHHLDPRMVWVCVAGIVFGGAGYWWAHFVHLVNDEGMSE